MPSFICRLAVARSNFDSVRKLVSKEFGAYRPREEYPHAYRLVLSGVTPLVVDGLERLLQNQEWEYSNKPYPEHKGKEYEQSGKWYTVSIDAQYSEQDFRVAKYVDFHVVGEAIDMDHKWALLNRFSAVVCKMCRLIEGLAVPEPYCVSEDNVSKPQDLYHAHNGIVIASERAKAVLVEVCGDSILLREAAVKHTKKKNLLTGRFYAVRPKHNIGHDVQWFPVGGCASCGRPKDWNTRMGPPKRNENKFERALYIVDKFGQDIWDIALSEHWNGTRKLNGGNTRGFTYWRFISGRLYTLLRKGKIKGLGQPSFAVQSPEGARWREW